MKNRYRKRFTGAAIALQLSSSAFSAPQQAPAGGLAFTPIPLTDGAGAPLEQAVLTYQGQNYAVSFSGLGLGGAVGVTVTVTGAVYGVSQLADLEGDFVSELAAETTADASLPDLWLYKDGGVSIHLQTDSPDVALATGGDAVTVHVGGEE
jgi:hypothetical protein